MKDIKLDNVRKIHIIGIGGSGVSSLAYWFLENGRFVSGSDREENDNTKDLLKLGVNLAIGHAPDSITHDLDLVVFSPAIPKNDPEMVRAVELKLPTLSHFEAVGLVAREFRVVAVTGTNGKSTTTAMLATIAEQAGVDPSVILGSKLNSWGRNCRVGKKEYFVVEADDYKRKFLSLSPELAVVTNVESDHLDYYKDIQDIKSAFSEFLSQVKEGGSIILNSDDLNSQEIFSDQIKNVQVFTYGKKGGHVRYLQESESEKDGFTEFKIELTDGQKRVVKIPVPGEHNIYNALAAYSAALVLGIEPGRIEEALASYMGIERRFQLMGRCGRSAVYSDYGHHPSAIVHTVRGARKFFPGKKILLVFQPHQHNRTKKLFNDFVEALITAEPDALIVAEIYDVAGRTSKEDSQISSRSMVERVCEELPFVEYSEDLIQTEQLIRNKAHQYDVILIMGAGDIHKVAQKLVAPNADRFLQAALNEGLKVKTNYPLRELTTWKVGGNARYLVFADSVDELVRSFELAHENGIEYKVMGGGSNVLISDDGFDGLVVVNKTNDINYGQDTVSAESGVAMGRLAADTLKNGFSGLEWAVGLPGTVGGAVFGNSNCWGGSTGASLISCVLWSPGGEEKEVAANHMGFDYDYSNIQKTGQIVLKATFKLHKVADEGEREKLKEKITSLAKERSQKQPLGAKVAGSVFKALKQTPDVVLKLDERLPTWREGLRDGFISPGFLIDKGLGLKGYKSGQVQISDLHANFFVNLGEATAEEVSKLIDFVKEQCKNKFGIELEEEIKYIE